MPKILTASERKSFQLSARVPEEVKARVVRVAEANDRTESYVVEQLILRDLALYERDGCLKAEDCMETPRRSKAA